MMFLLMWHVIISTFAASDASGDGGWIAVKRGVEIPYDLESTPLEIRTDSKVASGDRVRVLFYSAQLDKVGGVFIYFRSTTQYRPFYCKSSSTKLPPNLPSTTDKVWRITLTRINGIRKVVIHCNDVEVVNILLSDTLCSRSDWSEYWTSDVAWIKFSSDTASDYYKIPPPGVHNIVEYPDTDCINAYTRIGNCDGWSKISKEICIQLCEDNVSPDSTTCPPPAGGCRYAMWNHIGNWCHLTGDSCDWTDRTDRTLVDTKADWKDAVYDTYIPAYLDSSLLYLETNSTSGSGENAMIWYYDEENSNRGAGGFNIKFKSPVEYKIADCRNYKPFPESLPKEQRKVWIIEKRDYRTIVHCNGKKVLNITASSKTCDDRNFVNNWNDYWGREAVYFRLISEQGQAFNFYYIAGWRKVKPNKVIPHNMETTPLEIMALFDLATINESHPRQDDIVVEFYNYKSKNAGDIHLIFFPGSILQLEIKCCGRKFNVSLPSDQPVTSKGRAVRARITKISGDNPSIVLHFDNKEVANFKLFGESQVNSECRKVWRKDVKKVIFPSNNAASDSYRSYQLACASTTESSAVYGDYNWPETKPSRVVEQPCHNETESKALKYCLDTGIFNDTDFTACPSAAAAELLGVAEKMVNLSNVNQEDISSELETVTNENGNKMSSGDVKNSSEIIETFINDLGADLKTTTLANLIVSIDNVNTNTETKEIRRNQTAETFRNSSIAVAIGMARLHSPGELITEQTVGFNVAYVDNRDNSDRNENMLNLSSNGQLDTTFSANLTTIESKIATAVYYQNDKAFPSGAISSTDQKDKDDLVKEITNRIHSLGEVTFVASVISEINIVDRTTFKLSPLDPKQKVIMNFTIQEKVKELEKNAHRIIITSSKRKAIVNNKLTCKYYDYKGTKEWSSSGCETTLDKQTKFADHVICSCDHLSSFAVLMSFESDESEELVSEILLGLSLSCLLLSLVAILPNKKMVSLRSNRVHLMLILALILSIICFFLMDLFVTDDYDKLKHVKRECNDTNKGPDPSTPCSIVAFLLNYFWLCQLCWMVVEALAMYLALVKVLGTYISRVFMKYCLFGWGVPLIFPIIGIAWARSPYEFTDPRTCFVRSPYGMVSFYAPVVVGVSVNWICFIFIARAIVSAIKANVATASIDKKIKQLKSFLAVSALLGLSWVVGFFLLMNETCKNLTAINVALRWIFIILNAPQGCFIFLFFVFWNTDVRKFWLQRLKQKQLPLTSTMITGTTSVTASSSQQKSFATQNRGVIKTAKGYSVSDVNSN